VNAIENSIREIAKQLLCEKKVESIIGYEQGRIPLRSTPCFVDRVEDVQRLVWNATCDINLAKYLTGRKGKTAIIAKGCDARSIAVLLNEKQIAREKVFIIGVPCTGIVDRKKVEEKLEGKEIFDATVESETITLRGEGYQSTLPKKDLLCNSCATCKHKNPPVCDVFVGTKTSESTEVDEFSQILTIESESAEKRWEHFKEELGKCIRCYACRNVCPLCYCKVCFVDQTTPEWFGRTNELSDTMIYHLVRAFHLAGRCVNCGACSRACPMNIDLSELMKKIEKIVKERFNHEAGISAEKTPPLGEFKMNDPQEFIK